MDEIIKNIIAELNKKLDKHKIVRKLPFSLDDLKARAKEIENFRSFSREKKRDIVKLAIKQVRFFRDYLEIDYTFSAKPHKIRLP